MANERDELRKKAEEQYDFYDAGSKLWSTAHHWTLALSIISSAVGAFLLKIETVDVLHREDIAAGLAVLASVLTALAASGGFERKWRSNRLSRGHVHGVLFDLMADDANLQAARERLKRICLEHDEVVVGRPENQNDKPRPNS